MQNRANRPGYVLFAVLVVVVVLSLAAYRYADSMGTEYEASVRNTEAAQARASAVSGIHFAAGLIADPGSYFGDLGGNPYDNSMFAGVSLDSITLRGGARFSLVNVSDTGGGAENRYPLRYGAVDEGGKININALITVDPTGSLLFKALMALPNMTDTIADCIVDWVDPDDSPRTTGAEESDYMGSGNPYHCKNGPLNSVEELLLVRGVTPQLLFGNDRNRNGVLDPGEDDGVAFNRGWTEFLTCYGREVNIDSNGTQRININETDITVLAQSLTPLLGQALTDYVLYFRITGNATASTNTAAADSKGTDALRTLVDAYVQNNAQLRRKISSVFTIYGTQISIPAPAGSPPNTPATIIPCPLNDPNVLKQVLPVMLDQITMSKNYELTPRVNVNTAPREVLLALAAIDGGGTPVDDGTSAPPNVLSATDVDAIIAARASQSPTSVETLTGAWIVTSANISPQKFKTIEKYISGRTFTYRLHSVGYFVNAGPVARMEAVVDTALGTPRFLYFRDLTDLGRGFTNLPK